MLNLGSLHPHVSHFHTCLWHVFFCNSFLCQCGDMSDFYFSRILCNFYFTAGTLSCFLVAQASYFYKYTFYPMSINLGCEGDQVYVLHLVHHVTLLLKSLQRFPISCTVKSQALSTAHFVLHDLPILFQPYCPYSWFTKTPIYTLLRSFCWALPPEPSQF